MKARITAVVFDADNDVSPVSCYVNVSDSDTVSSLVSDFMVAFTDVISLFVTGAFKDVTLTLMPEVNTGSPFFLSSAPDVLSDVQEKAVFTFGTIFGRTFTMSIPTIDETIFEFSGAGKLADSTNAYVVALGALMTDDLVSGGINATDYHGSDITTFFGGEQRFGKG